MAVLLMGLFMVTGHSGGGSWVEQTEWAQVSGSVCNDFTEPTGPMAFSTLLQGLVFTLTSSCSRPQTARKSSIYPSTSK